ncbi:MAG: hypothetical protein CL416_05865 [Acidimicrobiaceae bacterium]|nr:hypothetical protein [Acidimicrobiaceae bacterium]
MAISFLDPRGESAVEPTLYDISTRLEPGVTVGLLANGFPDSVAFLDAVGEAIIAIRPGVTLARWDKGDASAIAGDEMLDEIEPECAAVIAAYGH